MRSEKVKVTEPTQLSVAVGGTKVGNAGQAIGVVCATQVIVGGVLSNTVMI